jgi:hypothetical protein
MLNEDNQIHNFISSSDSGTVINYGSGSGSDFLPSYGSGSGSGSTSQKVTVPTVPVPVPQHWVRRSLVGCSVKLSKGVAKLSREQRSSLRARQSLGGCSEVSTGGHRSL